MKYTFLLYAFLFLCLCSACVKNKTPNVVKNRPSVTCPDAIGPVEVFKTKQNYYYNNITVLLSSDGKSVLAYPGPQDAAIQKPVPLANGYYEKRMTGFSYTDITFDQYLNPANSYTPADLLNHVIDNDPFSELYECCNVSGRDTASLNNLIRNNQLSKCQNEN